MAIDGNVVVVGATGVVGGDLLDVLASRGIPAERVSALATQRRDGDEVEYGDETLEVEPVGEDAFRSVAVAFLATPADAARLLAQRAQAAGAWVFDASTAFLADANVPLAALGRPVAAPAKGRTVACATPTAAALWTLLDPLRESPGVAAVSVTALVGASSAGSAGVAELEEQTVQLMSGRDPEAHAFPHRIAFNVLPQVGGLDLAGDSSEELTWRSELARLWAEPPVIAGTAFTVPSFYGRTLALELELKAPVPVEQLRARLASAAHLKVIDAPAEKLYPMPMLVNADEAVHVGRLRGVPGRPNRVVLVASFDAVRRTAAAAVEAAEALARFRN